MIKIKKIDAKKFVIKRKLKFQDYINRLEAVQTENKVEHLK